MSLEPGLEATVTHVVTDADTAPEVGSGDVPVLATPRLLALMEAATVAAVRDRLPPGATTVGTHIALTHDAPTFVGGRVEVTARLDAVDGPLLVFGVRAAGCGEARVERHVVDRDRFLRRAENAAQRE
ncbi:MAG TPA: hotdog domain-containing protein [Mycobacteriales bacterium]|nr:hotdog domain-containing protein [Mycobacteriales bacterium]